MLLGEIVTKIKPYYSSLIFHSLGIHSKLYILYIVYIYTSYLYVISCGNNETSCGFEYDLLLKYFGVILYMYIYIYSEQVSDFIDFIRRLRRAYDKENDYRKMLKF